MKKNMEIEYLRAIAIGMTLLSHLPQLLPFHEETLVQAFRYYMPWTGVDLFFCISGFVVSSAYYDFMMNRKQNGQFGVACYTFWLRRAYRLLPTSWLWIFIPMLLSVVYNAHGSFATWQQHLWSFTAVATFTGNIANQFGVILGPNSVYWSLALEEQFYFLFPVFLLLVSKKKTQIIIIFVLIFIQFFVDRNPFGTSFTSMASSVRIDSILWGMLIFFASKSTYFKLFAPDMLLKSNPARLVALLFLVYILGAIPGQMIQMPIAVGLVAIVSAILVYLAALAKGYIYVPVFLRMPVAWLGSRSYGIYVIHVPAYHLSTEIWKNYGEVAGFGYNGGLTAELLMTSAVIIVIASELNYRLLEQPVRARGARLASDILTKGQVREQDGAP
ncbi:MAG: acyltransferase [Hahellaceae bacterium]|nr:acyltransferase [Hahellaceae bacterium]